MKPSHPDTFLAVNRDDYMTVLSIIANADNVLKEEEMSFFGEKFPPEAAELIALGF